MVALGALLTSEAIFILPGHANPQTLFLMIPALVLLLCGIFLLILFKRCHLDVGPEGIDCYHLWRGRQHTNWQDVHGARLFRFLGLDYLLLEIENRKRPLWLPLFVHRYDLFRDLFTTYAALAEDLEAELDQAA
jgi:hypothetical protein